MTQRARLISLVCAGFLTTIFLFTAGFLVYFEQNPLNNEAANSAAGTLSSYGGMNFGDITSLLILCLIIALLIFLIIKS